MRNTNSAFRIGSRAQRHLDVPSKASAWRLIGAVDRDDDSRSVVFLCPVDYGVDSAMSQEGRGGHGSAAFTVKAQLPKRFRPRLSRFGEIAHRLHTEHPNECDHNAVVSNEKM